MIPALGKTFVALLVLAPFALGCQRTQPAPPVTLDDPVGPILKTTGAGSEGLPADENEPPIVNYVCNGFARVATAEDRRAGRSELRIYNPARVENRIAITVYFDNQPPRELTRFTLPPQSNGWIAAIPADHLEFFNGAEAWAARIESSAPIVASNLLSAGVVAPGGDLWFGDPRYKGSNTAAPLSPTLSRHWLFSDGLLLHTDTPGPGQRFNEYEWYHVLNPSDEAVRVSMQCRYESGETEVFEFEVGAERVRIVDNRELVRANQPHSVEFRASNPVQINAERFISDFAQTNDWGAWVHTALLGVPAEQVSAGEKAR